MSSERFNPTPKQRDRAFATAMKRKEEYLGARVPKELRDRVIAKAKEQGIPVSILIRNILEDAFKDQPAAAPEVETPVSITPDRSLLDSVLAWDSISLNKSINCSKCGKLLSAGDDALMGLGSSSLVVICKSCD